MKTAELEGDDLNYWAARAEVEAGNFTFNEKVANLPFIDLWEGGLTGYVFSAGPIHFQGLPGEYVARGPSHGKWNPSSDWRFGGPLVEREQIIVSPDVVKGEPCWCACNIGRDYFYGPTFLIAAMRAFVASKFGDEVPDIKETA